MVPTENAALAGLRRVIDEETVKKVLDVLRDDVSEMPKNWNRRFKHNRDKIKTGDIYELAEVVRNLALRESEKGLSTGEKQMFTRTKKILASELMYALDKDEDEAESYLDELLADSATSQMARRRQVTRLRARGAGRRCGRVRGAARDGRRADRRRRAAASAWAPAGPRRSSQLAGRPMLRWSVDALRAVGGDRADRRRAARTARRARRAAFVGRHSAAAVRSESVRRALAGVPATATRCSSTTRPARW